MLEELLVLRKTKLWKAICKYLKKSQQLGKLNIAAFIANAFILINRSTIHSLIGLSIDPNMISQKIKNTKDDWPNIDYINFDEISMIGCTVFANIHLKMKI
jgi:divalent metal cation (Fe/Co/Zn/Cd) transporter